MKKSPLGLVKERFESKAKLVEAVQKLAQGDLWLDRVNGVKRLAKVSNVKLLRLHTLLEDAKKRFGSRQKLIDSILELDKRTKDKGYAASLGAFPLPRLLDLHGALTKAQKKSERKAKGEAKKPAKAEKKAAAKKAPAEKKPAAAKKAAAKKRSAKKTRQAASKSAPAPQREADEGSDTSGSQE